MAETTLVMAGRKMVPELPVVEAIMLRISRL